MKLIFTLLYAAAILMPSNRHQLKDKEIDTITQEKTVARQKLLKEIAFKKVEKVFTILAKEERSKNLIIKDRDLEINKYSLPIMQVIE